MRLGISHLVWCYQYLSLHAVRILSRATKFYFIFLFNVVLFSSKVQDERLRQYFEEEEKDEQLERQSWKWTTAGSIWHMSRGPVSESSRSGCTDRSLAHEPSHNRASG